MLARYPADRMSSDLRQDHPRHAPLAALANLDRNEDAPLWCEVEVGGTPERTGSPELMSLTRSGEFRMLEPECTPDPLTAAWCSHGGCVTKRHTTPNAPPPALEEKGDVDGRRAAAGVSGAGPSTARRKLFARSFATMRKSARSGFEGRARSPKDRQQIVDERFG